MALQPWQSLCSVDLPAAFHEHVMDVYSSLLAACHRIHCALVEHSSKAGISVLRHAPTDHLACAVTSSFFVWVCSCPCMREESTARVDVGGADKVSLPGICNSVLQLR